MSRASLLFIYALTVGAVAGLVSTLARDTQSAPFAIRRADLSGWSVVAGLPDEPWVVAAKPPDAFVASVRERIAGATGQSLMPLPRVVLPLILRQEFEDALQGIYGIDRLMQLAEDAGITAAQFEPVCIAQRVDPERGALVFLAVHAPEYWRYRADVEPLQPEQGGSGVFDPAALTAVVPVATTRLDHAPWWPLKTELLTDCVATLLIEE